MDNKTVGLNIRRFRRYRDMSQRELAEAAGYATKSSINKIESGEVSVPIPRLAEIASVLRVPIKALMENPSDSFVMYEHSNNQELDKPRTADNLGESVYHRFFSRNDAVSKAFKEFANTLMQEEQRKLSSADNKLLEKYSQLNKSNQQAVMMMIESLLAQQKAPSVKGEGS